jgi:hypothetical protein
VTRAIRAPVDWVCESEVVESGGVADLRRPVALSEPEGALILWLASMVIDLHGSSARRNWDTALVAR